LQTAPADVYDAGARPALCPFLVRAGLSFFRVSLSHPNARQTALRLNRSFFFLRSLAASSSKVASGASATTRESCSKPSLSKAGERPPPWGLALGEPLSRTRRTRSRTKEALTPK